jgi:PBSX family phage terminase large subunit
MPCIDYKPFSYQRKFQDSIKSKAYLSTGFGGGKTFSLCMKMFRLMRDNPGMDGGLLCPTIKMYKRDVMPTLREICYANNIPHQYNKSDQVWNFTDTGSSVFVFHSEDDGASIRGPNLAWGAINEVTLCSEMAFKALLGRVRLKRAKRLQVVMSGTPESFNWCYEYFIEKPRDDTDLIFGNATDNYFVNESYFDMLRDSYDEKMQAQYIDGKFVNLKGDRCVYAFDRFKHCKDNIDKLDGYPVLVSIDFNVTPMAATLWNRLPATVTYPDRSIKKQAELQAFDEIRLTSADTNDLCRAIKEKTSDTDQIILYPDPAGAARSTKARNLTDIDILRLHGFQDIRYKSRINVRNCLNALNAMFFKNNIRMNNKKCPNMIADLEQCTFREGIFEIDKSNLKRSHWLDGLKNMVEYEWPISAVRGFREERIR